MDKTWNYKKGNELRKFRLANRLNKQKFCKLFDISVDKLDMIELGEEIPTSKVLNYKRVYKKYLSDTQKTKNEKFENLKKIDTAIKKIPNIKIPTYSLEYVKNLIDTKKLTEVYQIDRFQDVKPVIMQDIMCLLDQEKKIRMLSYDQLQDVLKIAYSQNNWVCISSLLCIWENGMNEKQINSTYSQIELTVHSLFHSYNKECIYKQDSLIDLIGKNSPKYSSNYEKYNDGGILELLNNIKNGKDKIHFVICKEKSGSNECYIDLKVHDNGYLIELNNNGVIHKYFYEGY